MKLHWFYILLSVADGPSYGSAIQEATREASRGAVRLWPATLYGSLEELLERGWLEEAPDATPPEGSAGRERFYRITGRGRRALEAEAERLEGLAGMARAKLAGGA